MVGPIAHLWYDWQKNVLHDGDESHITLMDELMECQRDWWLLPYFQQLVFKSIVMLFIFFSQYPFLSYLLPRNKQIKAGIPYLSVCNWYISYAYFVASYKTILGKINSLSNNCSLKIHGCINKKVINIHIELPLKPKC